MQSIHLVLCFANFFLTLNTGFSHSLKRIPRESHDHWGYGEENGPHKWSKICQTGKKQSPVNIIDKDVINKRYSQFDFSEKYGEPSRWKVVNNGHSIMATLHNETDELFIGGAGLEGKYIFQQLHFHWGSEHTIDDEREPLELHLVHYSAKYDDFGEAVDKKGGIAVIGIFYDTHEESDDKINDIVDKIVAVSAKNKTNSHNNIPPDPNQTRQQHEEPIEFPALELFPEDVEPYYRYEGSLTTPDCFETVIWTVLKNKKSIAEKTLELFKNIPDNHGQILETNYRPTQDLHGRKVYFNPGHLNEIDEVTEVYNSSENLVFSKYLFCSSFYIIYYSLSSSLFSRH